MSHPESLQLSPEGRRCTDLPALERELHDLWRRAGAEAGATGVTRSALLNLVVVTPPDDAGACRIVTRIASEMPCRALVLETGAKPDAPPFEAWISAHGRRIVNGRSQLSCEQVTIRVAPDGVARLPSALLGLLLPDLPVVLYAPLPQDLGGAIVERLHRSIDRLFVDSGQAPAPDSQLALLARWIQERPGLEIEDLSWLRLEPWREMTAGFFDAPPFDAELMRLSQLEIRHDAGARIPALLYIGWIASRLQWQPRRWRGSEMTFDAARGPVTVQLLAGPDPEGTRPDLRQIELKGKGKMCFVLAAGSGPTPSLESRIETEAACPLPQRLVHEPASDAELLLRLLVRGRSRSFETALGCAARLVALQTTPA